MHVIGIGDGKGSNCVRWEVGALHVEFCACDGLKEYYLVVYQGPHLLHSSFQTQLLRPWKTYVEECLSCYCKVGDHVIPNDASTAVDELD